MCIRDSRPAAAAPGGGRSHDAVRASSTAAAAGRCGAAPNFGEGATENMETPVPRLAPSRLRHRRRYGGGLPATAPLFSRRCR
eukprot:2832076-Prymnesium_polylepis.1